MVWWRRGRVELHLKQCLVASQDSSISSSSIALLKQPETPDIMVHIVNYYSASNQSKIMANKTLDTIIENLFYVLPIFLKELPKIDPPDISRDIHLSRPHIGIMGILSTENRLPISEIGKKLLIAKPQMTRLINQLINAGMIERRSNTRDRRITEIILTEKGKVVFKQWDALLKTNLRGQLSFLSKIELEDLSLALQILRKMSSRLDNRGKQSRENESKISRRIGGNDVPKHII